MSLVTVFNTEELPRYSQAEQDWSRGDEERHLPFWGRGDTSGDQNDEELSGVLRKQ